MPAGSVVEVGGMWPTGPGGTEPAEVGVAPAGVAVEVGGTG